MKTTINKFGFEIEGEMSHDLQQALMATGFGTIVSDASVRNCLTRSCEKYHSPTKSLSTCEFKSKPILYGNQKVLVNKELITVFKVLKEYYQKQEFHWNKSCGFHIHISFKPKVPVEIWSLEFAKYFYKGMNENFKLAWIKRNGNSYCRVNYNEGSIADSTDRYQAINFKPAFYKHGTIEFRIFPTACPKTMRKYMSFTFKAIKDFLNNETHQLKRMIEFEPEDDAAKSRTIEGSVSDKPNKFQVEALVDNKPINTTI